MTRRRRRRIPLPSVADAPAVSIAVATSGIHPTTSRIVALALTFWGPDDTVVHRKVWRLAGVEDVGPRHLHGYRPRDFANAPTFATIAGALREAINGRTLILHQAGMNWGFLTHEFRRSQRSAARARRRGERPRGDVPTPTPARIIDTLGTARRQSVPCDDERLRAIAAHYGLSSLADAALPQLGAVASPERARTSGDELLAADSYLIGALNRLQHPDHVAVLDPADLTADEFGIQRDRQRVAAAQAARHYTNPGAWTPGEPLTQGMEFVVSPDIEHAPDDLIARGVAAGLVYAEKLNRRSSLVVCNSNHDLRGKAMHADRKNIPLIDDATFLDLLDAVSPGTKEAVPRSPGAGARPDTSGVRRQAPTSRRRGRRRKR